MRSILERHDELLKVREQESALLDIRIDEIESELKFARDTVENAMFDLEDAEPKLKRAKRQSGVLEVSKSPRDLSLPRRTWSSRV